jgi:hypothetical protein
MRYRYEIDNNKAVRIWDNENPNENDAPFFFQPDQPDGTPWADKAEAEAWAVAFIADLSAATPELDAPQS